MFKNHFFTVLVILALAAVAGLTVREAIATSSVTSNVEEADTARWEALGEDYANQAQRYSMDSATRSYIAQAKAVTCGVDATYGLDLDSATRSYIAWAKSLECQ